MDTPAILTLTLNPALDQSTETPQILPGRKLRCAEPRLDPGGGGINVSRMVHKLGGDTTAFVLLGGATGMRLVSALQEERISTRIVQISGETRASLSVHDATTNEQFRFMLPGPALTEAEYAHAIDALREEAAEGDYVVLSGSMPTGAEPGFAARLASALSDRKVHVVCDTSGAELAQLVREPAKDPAARPHILRFDHVEAEESAGRELPLRQDTARFAHDIVMRGICDIAAIGRQAEGNILATAEGAWFARSAPVDVVSTIGAGDSFVGALVWALSDGASPADALRWGTAAACGAVSTPGTAMCDPETVERLRVDCPCEAIDL